MLPFLYDKTAISTPLVFLIGLVVLYVVLSLPLIVYYALYSNQSSVPSSAPIVETVVKSVPTPVSVPYDIYPAFNLIGTKEGDDIEAHLEELDIQATIVKRASHLNTTVELMQQCMTPCNEDPQCVAIVYDATSEHESCVLITQAALDKINERNNTEDKQVSQHNRPYFITFVKQRMTDRGWYQTIVKDPRSEPPGNIFLNAARNDYNPRELGTYCMGIKAATPYTKATEDTVHCWGKTNNAFDYYHEFTGISPPPIRKRKTD